MKINIYEEKFLEVTDIILIKTYVKRLSDYKILNDTISGQIFVDISYYDKNMLENFKSLNIDYAVILKDDMIVKGVDLAEVTCELIDQKGVNVKYNLDINYDLKEDKEFLEIKEDSNQKNDNIVIEDAIDLNSNQNESIENTVVTSDVVEKSNEEQILDSVKESLKEDYDDMLEKSLSNRTNLEISSTKNDTEESFLDMFNSFESKYLCIKKMHVSVEEAEHILDEKKINKDLLKDFYDEGNHILTLRSYE